MPVLLGDILDTFADLAILCDQRSHDVVDRLEIVGLRRRRPGEKGQHVVPGFGLRFGCLGQIELVGLRGDVVDRNVDLLLRGPFLAQLGQGVVGAGNPMIPKAHGEPAGGEGAVDERRRQCGRCGCLQKRAAREPRNAHSKPSLCCRGIGTRRVVERALVPRTWLILA